MITSVAVTSLIVSCLAFIAVVAIRRTQLEMAAALTRIDRTRRSEKIESLSYGMPTVAVVTQLGCPACKEVAASLAEHDSWPGIKLVVLSADGSAKEYAASNVEAVIDPVAVGRLFVDAMPIAIELAADGLEVRRQIMGSPNAVREFIERMENPERNKVL